MKILAIEFSTNVRSVAAVEALADGTVLPRGMVRESAGRATPVFPMLDTVLAQAGWAAAEVDRLAVGLGPGSYTGIRMALATAQGWQLARPVAVCGLDSTRVLAWGEWQAGRRGDCWVAVDAQRGDFYLAGFQLSADGCAVSSPLRLVTAAEAGALVGPAGQVVGPEMAARWRGGVDAFPSAEALGTLAAQESVTAEAATLEPIYLRPVSFVKQPPARRPSVASTP